MHFIITRECLCLRLSWSHVRLALTCGLMFSAISPAQTRRPRTDEPPPSDFKLVSIQVAGTKRYQPEDIIRASGLQIGQTAHDDDFKDVTRLLGESGAFSGVSYSFRYSPKGTELELQVADAERFAPVRFENLVWFSDRDLIDQLHARVPLFRGELPVTGPLPDQVSEALQALLIEKGVPGSVDYLRVGPEDGPVEAFAFSVTGPHIIIRNIKLSGADASDLRPLENTAQRLEGAVYVRSVLRTQEEKILLPIFLERGYLKAAFGDAQPEVVQSEEQQILADVTFPISRGLQYRLTSLELAGNKVFPADALRQKLGLQLNQPANAVELAHDIEAMQQLYGTHGYMQCRIQATPEIDDTQSTVRYAISIDEGGVYKMGDLEIQGLDSRTTARLQGTWNLRSGDTYDSSYPARFLQQVYKEMGDWNVAVHESLNRKDLTVDVTLRFDSKSQSTGL